MASSKQPFRQAAMDRLSSPEQLDQMMEVTTSRAWMALASMGLLILVTIGWGFLGELPTTVHGVGILIKTSGLADVATTGSGQITQVYVGRGDNVQSGDVIARLAQPELVEQVTSSKARLEELRADHSRLLEFGGEGTRIRTDVQQLRRTNLRAELRSAKERRTWMIERVESRKRLFNEGLITKQQLQTTTVQLQTAEDTIADLNAELGRLRLDDLTSDKRHDAEVRSSEFEIREAERRMGFLVEKLALSTEILSVHTGRVLELRAGPGDVVTTGAPLLSIELSGDDSHTLEALIYIPSAEGKQVKPGMTVRVAPSVARPEEHGMVMATVTSVAEFPSTSRGMMRVLDNQELVSQLIRQTAGAPIAVRVVLDVDEQTPSGYRWSSGDGPDLRLTSGTSCAATVTTELQRPISLVVPAFRKWLGL